MQDIVPLLGEIGESRGVGVEAGLPLCLPGLPSLDGFAEMMQSVRRNMKSGLQRPPQSFFGEPDFFRAQGGAVGSGRVLLVGATVGDVGAGTNEGRAVQFGARRGQGLGHCIEIVAVDLLHVPSVGFKPLGDIFRKRQAGVALDGDVVVIVQIDKLAQLQMTGQGGGLRGHALHQVSVAHDGIGEVVHNGMSRTVEGSRQIAFSQRHSHPVAETLPQRAGGSFHAGGQAVLGVAWGSAAPLSEPF